MNLSRFRLPVIWTAGTISLLTLLHLIGVYIYEWWSVIGIPGWSINIWLVWQSPDIPNPMQYSQNKEHDLILSFLFRSLIRYNTEAWIYEWDLANCDLTDLSKVICILSGSGTWSDNTEIKIDDIIATYQAFKANPPSDKMRAFLGKVAIVSKDAKTIELTSNEKNSLMLDLLWSPILRSDMIERIRTGRLWKDGYVTSWAYVFLEKEKNTQYGYDRITIGKNIKNNATGWLDKYNFLFFPDAASLERSADILSVIVPTPLWGKMLLGPRFVPYEYAMYEYIGLFLNTDTINNAIRKYVLLQSQSGLSGSVVKNERPISELFPQSTKTPIKLEKNLSDILRDAGYRKADDRMSALEQDNGMLSGSSIEYGTNIYFDTPSKSKIVLSEVAWGEITLAGNVPIGVQAVMINGYSLKEYLPGNSRFTYKVSIQDGTLIEGKNAYTIEFESLAGSKTTRDTIEIYYSRDPTKISELKKEVDDTYLAKLNTPELIRERLKKVTDEKTKLQALNPRYYYNSKYAPYELTLVYLSDPASLETYAKNISNTLLNIGIKVNTVAMSSKDFSAMMQKWEKNYDLIIIGFEATGRFSRIGQIFLSTEAKNGINFAKIESKNLDALFASLRISYIKAKTDEIIGKIGDIIHNEAFFLPISSPLHTFYIDRNLKGIRTIPTFQDITTLYWVVQKASIKEEYILNLEGKWITGFFSWFWWKISL